MLPRYAYHGFIIVTQLKQSGNLVFGDRLSGAQAYLLPQKHASETHRAHIPQLLIAFLVQANRPKNFILIRIKIQRLLIRRSLHVPDQWQM
jgi:hypothetical protein